MTDPALVAKKLALVETCLSELRRLARPEALTVDVREQRFVEHTLQIAIQAALDVASHIVSGPAPWRTAHEPGTVRPAATGRLARRAARRDAPEHGGI